MCVCVCVCVCVCTYACAQFTVNSEFLASSTYIHACMHTYIHTSLPCVSLERYASYRLGALLGPIHANAECSFKI